ncbi:MAG: hypothetical protein ABDH31_03605 [Chlorobiota bacterium]
MTRTKAACSLSLTLLLALLLPKLAAAQQADTVQILAERERLLLYQERIGQVLGTWAIGSVGVGLYQTLSGGTFVRFMGYQNVAWGAIDGAIALYGLWDQGRKRRADPSSINWRREREAFARRLLINAGLDLLYISVGAFLLARGKDERWRGTGAGILLQGSFLLLLDSIGYILVR